MADINKEYQDYLDDQEYQHYQQASAQAQNPQVTPDAASKAAHPSQQTRPPEQPSDLSSYLRKGLSAITALHGGQVAGMTGGYVDPSKAFGVDATGGAMADSPGFAKAGKAMGGSVPGMAMGAGMAAVAPAGAGLLPAIGRIGVNAAGGALQGGLEKPEEGQTRLGNAGTGLVVGGGLSALSEAAGGIYGGLKRMYNTSKLAANPVKMQDTAQEAIQDAAGRLRSSESENLGKALSGKSVDLDTTQIRGISPEIDTELGKYAGPYGNLPSEANVPAQDANRIRSLIDQQTSYKKLGPFAQTAETATADQALKTKADRIRSQLHGLGEDVSGTLDTWSENLNQARNLSKRAETAPVTVLTSPSVDRRAMLQRTDQRVGTNLQDLGNQLLAAKNLSNAVHHVKPVKAAMTLGLEGLRGGAKGGAAAANPEIVQSLFGAGSAASKK